jgi:DNA-directed RNA polymerase specialized sigma24 family protein
MSSKPAASNVEWAMDSTAAGEEFEEAPSRMSLLTYLTTDPALGAMSTLRGELGPALAELSTRQRQVLSLRYLAGLDDVDVSEALGISVKAVKKYAAQGTAALRARKVVREGSSVAHGSGGAPQGLRRLTRRARRT